MSQSATAPHAPIPLVARGIELTTTNPIIGAELTSIQASQVGATGNGATAAKAAPTAVNSCATLSLTAKIGITAGSLLLVSAVVAGAVIASVQSSGDERGNGIADCSARNGTAASQCRQIATASPVPSATMSPSAAASASPTPAATPTPSPSSSPGALRLVQLSDSAYGDVSHARSLGDCLIFSSGRSLNKEPFWSCVNRSNSDKDGWWQVPEGQQLYDPKGQTMIKELNSRNNADPQSFQAFVDEEKAGAGFGGGPGQLAAAFTAELNFDGRDSRRFMLLYPQHSTSGPQYQVQERTKYDQYRQAKDAGQSTLGPPFNGTLFVRMGGAMALGTFRLSDPYPNYITPTNAADVRTSYRPVMLPLPDGTHDDTSSRILYLPISPAYPDVNVGALVFPKGAGAAAGDPSSRPFLVGSTHPQQNVKITGAPVPFGGVLYVSADVPAGGVGLFRFVPDRLNETTAAEWQALADSENATASDLSGGSLTLVRRFDTPGRPRDPEFIRVAFGRLFFVANAPDSSQMVLWALEREMSAAHSYVPQTPVRVLAASPGQTSDPLSLKYLQATRLTGEPAFKGWSMSGEDGSAESGWLWFSAAEAAFSSQVWLYRLRVDGPEADTGGEAPAPLPGQPEIVQNRLDGNRAALQANGTDVNAGVLTPVRVSSRGGLILPVAGSIAVIGDSSGVSYSQAYYAVPDA